MQPGQHLKTPLAVALAIGAIGAPAAWAHSGQVGWGGPGPDQLAAQLASEPPARDTTSSWVVRPNPDQQATEAARLTAARAAHSSTWVVRPNPDEQIPTPSPATIVRVTNPTSGFDWGDAGIGAASGLGLAMIALAGALAITHHRTRQTRQSTGAMS